MGYSTFYELSVVGVPGLVREEEDREIRKMKHLKYDEFILFLEDRHTNQLEYGKKGVESFRIAEEDFMEIPVHWLYDFWRKDAEPCKWYGHEKDMKAFSRHFPDLVFKLEGRGEEPGDLWVKYFKNGKMQRCHAKITFAPFDENKLE